LEPFLTFARAARRIVLVTVAVTSIAVGAGLGQGAAAAGPVERAGTVAAVPAPAAASAAAVTGPRLTKMVTQAIHQTTLGTMYLTGGGHGPRPAPLGSRVDCSGFIRQMYHWAFGTDIGNGTADSVIRLSGQFVRTTRPVPGDVALIGRSGNAPAYHAGIYLGIINGQEAMAAAPSPGQSIKIERGYLRYWSGELMGYWHYKGATAADSGPVVTAKMAGHFDAAAGTPAGIRVAGWALDPQRKASSAPVSVSIDNRPASTVPTRGLRADVNRVMRATGLHGFSAVVPHPKPGRHTVCITARPAGSTTAPVSLGCKNVVVPGPTRGAFDSAAGSKLSYTVRGWAFDPNSAAASSIVRVTVDGRAAKDFRAGAARADVNRIFRITGSHGFSVRLAATKGRHTVCAIAQPLSGNSYAHPLGCKVVTVTG
jgi:hypothetical protein